MFVPVFKQQLRALIARVVKEPRASQAVCRVLDDSDLRVTLGCPRLSRQGYQQVWEEYARNQRTRYQAGLLRCLQHYPALRGRPWAVGMAAEGLRSQDAELRDAAIGCLKIWKDASSMAYLREHRDSDPFLHSDLQNWLRVHDPEFALGRALSIQEARYRGRSL